MPKKIRTPKTPVLVVPASSSAPVPHIADDDTPAGFNVRQKIEDECLEARELVAVLHYAQLGHSVTVSGDDYPGLPEEVDQAFDFGVARIVELLNTHLDTIVELAFGEMKVQR